MSNEELDVLINKGNKAMNRRDYTVALKFFNYAIKRLKKSKDDFYYAQALDRLKLVIIDCKTRFRDQLLEKTITLVEDHKTPQIIDNYSMIIKLTKEIGDISSLKKFEQTYEQYVKIYREEGLKELNPLIAEAKSLKDRGELEKSLEVYETALKGAKIIQDNELIKNLEEEVKIIPIIMLEEKRKTTVEKANEALKGEQFFLAKSLYKLASKYSSDLGDIEKEKEFLEEINRIDRIKDKTTKQRKKVDNILEETIYKAEGAEMNGLFFEAIKLYQKARKLKDPDLDSDDYLKNIDYCIEPYFVEFFMEDNIPEQFREVIKIAEEMSEIRQEFSLIDLYENAVKRLLIPKKEIAAIIYILYLIHVLL